MVWKLGVQVESIFDKLRQNGKKGVLFGCAHLIDAFGDDVESFTAVEKNDVVDTKIMARAKEIMKRENPDLMVIQMIAVDQTGHSRGVLYPEYLEKIKESDRLIEDFYRWMDREGYLDNTVVVVMADHGQGNGIGGHGHLDTGERFVPFLLNGPCIKQGVEVKEHRSIVSLAPTIARLLGVPFPEKSRGPVLEEAIGEASSKGATA
jgi:predicted AlkP superfamily pyrophosphatase or phosphodiesterase